MMFVDEPYLASIGSAYVSISRQQVLDLLIEVLGGLRGLRGVHCCGNTDWPLLLSAPIDVLSFDAFNHGETLALFPAEVGDFLARGGWLAWGIVPVGGDDQVWAQTLDGLDERLEAAFDHLVGKGVPRAALENAALLTPACGLGTLSVAGATRALELLAALSERFGRRYAPNAVTAQWNEVSG
jgi:hypothetical protein